MKTSYENLQDTSNNLNSLDKIPQSTSKNTHKNTRKKGNKYEEIALQYLISLGFTFIEKNFYTQYGEIDLIMQREETLHFIEVKSSSSFNPLYNITKRKLQRLVRAIEIFMTQRDLDMDFCIDSISIYNDEIAFVENVTI